ncbi:MAG: ShlB/FhaC/HecB family hemolysin secretion/activation protein [Rhodoferax sp.]|nr:ShlB/FhaC/HecB family hemolysin secretion/activation protein [Rhodoferax sp.]
MNTQTLKTTAVVCALWGGISAVAQTNALSTNPAAMGREVQRQLEKGAESGASHTPASEPVVGKKATSTELPADAASVRFTLQRVEFAQSKFFTEAELQAYAAPLVGQSVSFADLQRLVDQINEAYTRRKIFTAAAVLPTQTLRDGAVRIDLVEGKFGSIRFEGNTLVGSDYLGKRLERVDAGATVDLEQLELALTRFNNTSAVRLSANLVPGATFGTTDAVIAVQEPERNSFDFYVSNAGFKSTGVLNSGAVWRHMGLLGTDDRLTASLSYADGLQATNVGMDVPVGREGARLGVNASESSVKVIDGAFTSLKSTGKSESYGVNGSVPLWTTLDTHLAATGAWSKGRTRNYAAEVLLNESSVDTLAVGLNYETRWEGNTLKGGLTISQGHDDTHNDNLKREFVLYTGDLNWDTAWDALWSSNLRIGWQNSDGRELPSASSFQIGGASTVRGYEAGALAGDGGVTLSVQMNRVVNPVTTVFGFLDYGAVHSAIVQPNRLASVGVGGQWRIGKHVYGETSLAFAQDSIAPDQNKTMLHMRWIASF